MAAKMEKAPLPEASKSKTVPIAATSTSAVPQKVEVVADTNKLADTKKGVVAGTTA